MEQQRAAQVELGAPALDPARRAGQLPRDRPRADPLGARPVPCLPAAARRRLSHVHNLGRGCQPGDGSCPTIAIADGPDTMSVWDLARGRMLERFPTLDGLAAAAFVDDDHVAVGGDSGRLELIDVSVPPVPPDEVARRVATSPRWRLVDGHVIEPSPSEAVR